MQLLTQTGPCLNVLEKLSLPSVLIHSPAEETDNYGFHAILREMQKYVKKILWKLNWIQIKKQKKTFLCLPRVKKKCQFDQTPWEISRTPGLFVFIRTFFCCIFARWCIWRHGTGGCHRPWTLHCIALPPRAPHIFQLLDKGGGVICFKLGNMISHSCRHVSCGAVSMVGSTEIFSPGWTFRNITPLQTWISWAWQAQCLTHSLCRGGLLLHIWLPTWTVIGNFLIYICCWFQLLTLGEWQEEACL